MSPRPYWKGYLKLSLVSCPIAVHAACSSAERVSFRQISRKTGNRLRQQLIDEETDQRLVDAARAPFPQRGLQRASHLGLSRGAVSRWSAAMKYVKANAA